MSKIQILECSCKDKLHQVTIEYEYDKDVRLISIGMNFVSYLPWYKRLVLSIKYILGFKTSNFAYDCAILDDEEKDRLYSILYSERCARFS